MGFLDGIRKFTHPYDEDDDEEYEEMELAPRKETVLSERQSSKDSTRRNKALSMPSSGQPKVVVLKPTRFDSSNEIADQLRDKRGVLLNLESTNKDVARRLLDFMAGAAYVLDGDVKQVATNTYLISPHNMDVEGDMTDDMESSGLYF